jgi:pimeloyl-ACP methyl ester carboxylesterase
MSATAHPRAQSPLSKKPSIGLFGAALFGLIAACTPRPMQSENPDMNIDDKPEPVQAERASINGISMYYEIHGDAKGTPLVLLHGGGSSIDVTYGRILPFLARHRTVIARDEQAHGRTGDRDGAVRFDTSADDVATLLRHLKIEKADVMGFSNGASIALQVAIRHPDLVRKLIFASSMTKRSGALPQFWGFLQNGTFADMPQPLKDAFLEVNPDPQKLRNMHDKDLERMQHFVETSDEDVRSVKAPTLVLLGDRDVPTPAHAIELVQLLPQARLLILPSGHGDYLGELTATRAGSRYPELTASLIEEFLNSPMGQ